MVASCCYCGIPLQRFSQYIGIFDVIMGLTNLIVLAIHVRDIYAWNLENDGPSYISNGRNSHYGNDMNGNSNRDWYGFQIKAWCKTRCTFPGLEIFPRELVVTVLVCYGVQMIMGVVLYVAAANKNRGLVQFWMVVTAITALFTGLFIRLYELLIVNEFTHELKEEEEVTYFAGHNPQTVVSQSQLMAQPQPPTNPGANSSYPMISPVEPNVSMISGSGGTGGIYPQLHPQQPPTNPFLCYEHPDAKNYPVPVPQSNQTSFPLSPQNPGTHQFWNLQTPQPPPRYDAAVNNGLYETVGGGVNNNTANNGPANDNGSVTQTSPPAIPTIMFPPRDSNGRNGFETKFSKF